MARPNMLNDLVGRILYLDDRSSGYSKGRYSHLEPALVLEEIVGGYLT
jgi:hypothetical protein